LRSQYEPDVEYTGEMSSDNDNDDGEKLKLKTYKFQNVMEYVLFYSFRIFIKIWGEFYTVAAVRDPSVLYIDPGR